MFSCKPSTTLISRESCKYNRIREGMTEWYTWNGIRGIHRQGMYRSLIEERSLSINIIAEILFLTSHSSIGYLFYLICGPSAVP